ncbi:MAG: hypothetical protein H5T74_13445 [Actinobacteria bacterium]|nr:hypothetical protein [Actinomycetota bacterium]MDI6831697.1 hypothetical protein [Actinomycetota bacterium]
MERTEIKEKVGVAEASTLPVNEASGTRTIEVIPAELADAVYLEVQAVADVDHPLPSRMDPD